MEQSFILACLTHRLQADDRLPDPSPDVDWDQVYRLLVSHSLAGVFYTLGQEQAELWPKGLRDRLREDRYWALLRGDVCARQVQAVLSALRQADIPVIALKGWALIPTVYGGDYGQRTYQDADLLVLPRDAERAEGVLHQLGYRGTMVEPWPGYRRRFRNSRPYQLPHDPAPLGKTFFIGLH